MKIIVGLGNPGRAYESTPHNAGFVAVDKIKAYLSSIGYSCSDWSLRKKEKSEICEILFSEGRKFAILVKPQTYMNLSGSAVYQINKTYGVKDLTELLVIYDELDVPLGKFKYSPSKNSHTHNGVASILSSVGKDFHSLRIGVDNRTDRRITGRSFVLKRYSKDELVILNHAIDEAIELHVHSFLGLV